jgi:hypothetical protein
MIEYLFKIVRCGLQKLLTISTPTFAVAYVRTQSNYVKPQSDTVSVPTCKRHLNITEKRRKRILLGMKFDSLDTAC